MKFEDVTFIREVEITYKHHSTKPASQMRTPEEAFEFLAPLIKLQSREHFVAVFFDVRRFPISYHTVSIGTADAAIVNPREVFQAAVGEGASSLLLAHNHPSGHSSPSKADRDVTERLYAAGVIMGIPLVDHLIVAADGYYSFRNEAPGLFIQ